MVDGQIESSEADAINETCSLGSLSVGDVFATGSETDGDCYQVMNRDRFTITYNHYVQSPRDEDAVTIRLIDVDDFTVHLIMRKAPRL